MVTADAGADIETPPYRGDRRQASEVCSQVVLRWDIQQEILLVVKSVKPEQMRSNADVFVFSLTDEEMEQISSLNENLRVGPDPDTFNFRR